MMIVSWIVITLLIALVAGIIGAALGSTSGESVWGFFAGFAFVVNLSFWIGAIYVAGHFIGKYW